MTNKTIAIILAGGSGQRLGGDVPKQNLLLEGVSVLERSVKAFSDCSEIDGIVVVCREDDVLKTKELLCSRYCKIFAVIKGGESRAASAKNGFLVCPSDTDFVAIHDAARCLITPEMIAKVVKAAKQYGAATACAQLTDTVKRVTPDGKILETVAREELRRAQTPQIFSYELYEKALLTAYSDSLTDDNMLLEKIGVMPALVDLGDENLKITTKADFLQANAIIRSRKENERGCMYNLRVGHGYDVHRFAEERRLVLGGVEIPFEKGLLGHSDADVLLHAIMDSLLGALSLGDIGKHFPDTDGEFLGISSVNLLTRVGKLMRERGATVVNIDATVILQKPKISPFVEKMRQNIAFALNIDVNAVNIKGTTEEHLGFTGSGEGAAAHAVSLVSLA